MEAVIAVNRALGHEATDVSTKRLAYGIEPCESGPTSLRIIEVKCRAQAADSASVTRNETLTALNAPDAFIFAISEVSNDVARTARYNRRPFTREPAFQATRVAYELAEVPARAQAPS